MLPIIAVFFIVQVQLIEPKVESYIEKDVVLVVEEEPTADEYIDLMADKYGQNASLGRLIMDCEAVAYARSKGIEPQDVKGFNYDEDGVIWSVDVGRWQINDRYHQQTAVEMDLDIYKDFDNIEYGFYLMSKKGTQPWIASEYCWDK